MLFVPSLFKMRRLSLFMYPTTHGFQLVPEDFLPVQQGGPFLIDNLSHILFVPLSVEVL